MFHIVDASCYNLLNMLEQRVREHPERALFRELDKAVSLWSYSNVFTYIKKIAAAFYNTHEQPHVLLCRPRLPDLRHTRRPG